MDNIRNSVAYKMLEDDCRKWFSLANSAESQAQRSASRILYLEDRLRRAETIINSILQGNPTDSFIVESCFSYIETYRSDLSRSDKCTLM